MNAVARTATNEGRLELPRDVLRWALFGYILVGIARIHDLFPFLSPLRPGLLLFAGSVGWAFLNPKSVNWSNLTGSWTARFVGILTLVYGVSAIFGLSFGASMSYFLEDYSKIILSTFVIMAAIRTPSDLWLFFWAYAVCMLLWVYMAFFVFETSQHVNSATARLSNLYSYDANDLGLILIMGIPFVLIVMHVGSRMWKMLAIGILLGTLGAIAMTGSRGALVGLVGVLGFMLLTGSHISVSKRGGFAVAAALALVVAAPPGYWDQMRTILDPSDDYNMTSQDGRKEIAKRGLDYMWRYPVTGLGPMNFGRAEITISTKAQNAAAGVGIKMIAPHNTFVQVGAELGFTGLIIWCYMLIRGWRGGGRWKKKIPKRWRRGTQEERFLYYCAIYFPVAFVGFILPSVFVSFAYLMPFYLLIVFYGAFERMVAAKLKADQERETQQHAEYVEALRQYHAQFPAVARQQGTLMPG